MNKEIIISLVIVVLFAFYYYQQTQAKSKPLNHQTQTTEQTEKLTQLQAELAICEQDLKTLTLEKLKFLQEKETQQEIITHARKLFWQLRIAGESQKLNQREIKNLISQMRKNPLFEEEIPNNQE